MKIKKKNIIISILVIIMLLASFIIGRQVGLNTEQSSMQTIIRQESVEQRTIKKTLTSSGYIAAKTNENLTLDTSKYFKAMCVEEDDAVASGSNILEYTDGTYFTCDSNLVVLSYNLPSLENICTSSNYIEVSYTDNLQVTISVNENEISLLQVGQGVEISLNADTTKTYNGKITKIDSVGNYSASGSTFSAVVEFENDGEIKLGMGVSCEIILSEETTNCIPIDAVHTNSNNEEYVTVINSDGTTSDVIITTGISDDSYVQVLSGLELGQNVQIETEVTQSTNTSNSNSNSMQGFSKSSMGGQGGGEFDQGGRGGDFNPNNMGSMPNMEQGQRPQMN